MAKTQNQRSGGEFPMVGIARRKPVVVLKVVDVDGRAIGEVMHPKVAPIVGRGARTVLLVRDQRLAGRSSGPRSG